MAHAGAAVRGLRRLGASSLARAEGIRGMSAAPGPAGKASQDAAPSGAAPGQLSLGRFTADKDDIVLNTFKHFQSAYRGLMEGLKDIPLPLGGDDAAVKKFAQKVEALKRKVKYPDGEALEEATLNYKARCARGDARKFLTSAVEGRELSKRGQDIVDSISLAMDEAEKAGGGPLASSKKARELLRKKLKAITDEYGIGKVSKEEAKLDMYKEQLKRLREKVEEDIEIVKRREGLDFVNIDPSSLRLKW